MLWIEPTTPFFTFWHFLQEEKNILRFNASTVQPTKFLAGQDRSLERKKINVRFLSAGVFLLDGG